MPPLTQTKYTTKSQKHDCVLCSQLCKLLCRGAHDTTHQRPQLVKYSLLREIYIETVILTHHYCVVSFVLCSGTTTQHLTQFTTQHTIQGFWLLCCAFGLCEWWHLCGTVKKFRPVHGSLFQIIRRKAFTVFKEHVVLKHTSHAPVQLDLRLKSNLPSHFKHVNASS